MSNARQDEQTLFAAREGRKILFVDPNVDSKRPVKAALPGG